jgi:Transposase zinc-binding domain
MRQCHTPAKRGRVYACATEEKKFFNPCKSPICPSCGFRANEKWRGERNAALPNIIYHGMTFSMPDVLWRIFRDNPQLAEAVPALAAADTDTCAIELGARPGIVAILHTFNGKLEFNYTPSEILAYLLLAQSGKRANLGSDVCSPATEEKASSEASSLGDFPQGGLRR